MAAATLAATAAPAVATGGHTKTNAVFISVDQKRVLDTREKATTPTGTTGLNADNKVDPKTGPVTINIKSLIDGVGKEAGTVNAVVLNLTVVDAAGPGFLTAWGEGVKPLASNVNYTTGDVVANGATLPINPQKGTLSFYSSAATHLLVDVMGFYQGATKPAKGFTPVAPTRLLDSREGTAETPAARLAAGSTTTMNIATSYGKRRAEVKKRHKRHKELWEKHKQNRKKKPGAKSEPTATAAPTAGAAGPEEEQPKTGPTEEPKATGDDQDSTDERKDDDATEDDDDNSVIDDEDGTEVDDDQIADEDEHDKQCKDGDELQETEIEAVVLNVTAVNPKADGFLTIWPGDADQPETSSLNYAAGKVVANNVVVKVDDTTQLKLFTLAETDVVVDIVGFFADSDGDEAAPQKVGKGSAVIDPVRVFDSREVDSDEAAAAQRRVIKVAGVHGLPENLALVFANVTVTDTDADGFVTLGPAVPTPPTTSQLNYSAGDTRANGTPVRVAADGTITVYTHTKAEVVVDIVGYNTK